MAVVAFDATSRKYEVLGENFLNVETGTLVENEGRQLTIMQTCDSVEDAEKVCNQRSDELSNAELAVPIINTDSDSNIDHPDASLEYSADGTPESSTIHDTTEEVSMLNDDTKFFNFPRHRLKAVQDLLENMMDEFAKDVNRINRRYLQIRLFLTEHFGTSDDGSITNNFDYLHPPELKLTGDTCELLQPRQRLTSEPLSFFDCLATTQPIKRREAPPSNNNRNHPGINYPYISRIEEERIYKTFGHTFTSYAQHLGKIVFYDTLEKPFKEQDQRKREWIHEAVEYRFPSEDQNVRAQKWRNCAIAINKNMKNAEHKENERPVPKPREINHKHVTKEYEESCYERANGDPIKYAEYLAFKVFEDTKDTFFKDQDSKKKEWIRECVDRRYYLHDRERRDHRWKICAAACNKNRTKILDADGNEDPFPYFPEEIEIECFNECGGIAAVYAELMAKHLFPDTGHLFFKDQDIGKRHWLHDILDRRFPTQDKVDQIAKWKSCTAAINKAQSGKVPETPVEPLPKAKIEIKETTQKNVEPKPKPTPEPIPPAPVTRDNKRRRTADETKNDNVEVPMSKRVKALATPSNVAPPVEHSQSTPKRKVRAKASIPQYTSYPFISVAEEQECLLNCNNNVNVYSRILGGILFKDSKHLYYKDQDPDRKTWLREVVDFRFPTAEAGSSEYRQKWKNITAAINKNMGNG